MKPGAKYLEKIMDSSEVAFSVMFTRNAEGDVLPLYVVYKSIHLYDWWVKGDPAGARTIKLIVVGLMKKLFLTGF